MLLISTAMAWQSICYTGSQDLEYLWHPAVCEDGYEKARSRWVLDDTTRYTEVRTPEHALIWEYAETRSGIPIGLFDDQELTTYIRPELLGVDEFTSVWPRRDLIGEEKVRTLSPAEMTQLPDMSYTLWDWATGNESCPISDGLDVQLCHRFERHMGGMNSSHFLPQSQGFYRWYHELALQRADQCRVAHGVLEDQYEDRPEFEEYVLACEKSAIVLEAVGQHYLQDSWSSGHMWERWGSPEFADWEAISTSPEQALGRAMVVALLAGSWHGSKAMLDDPSSPVYASWFEWEDYLRDGFDDPMCAPAPRGDEVDFHDPWVDDMRHGIGDIFFSEGLVDSRYHAQVTGLASCSVNGMRQVYERTGQAHGEIQGRATGINPLRDPSEGDTCFGQRVSNEAIDVGADVHAGAHPDQISLTGGLDHAGDLHIVIWALAGFKLSGDEIDIDGLGEQFRREAAAFMTYASVAAEFRPDDTDASTGFSGREGPSTLLGIHPNSRYAISDGEAPASWVDPELPWDLDEPESEALSLVFADGSAWERCDLMEVEDLTALRHLAWPLQPTEQDLAIRGLCEQLVEPFLRVGSGEDNYRSDAQPLCHSAGTEVFVYSGHADPQDITRDEALDAFCTGGLLDDGGFEQRSGWTVDRNADVVSGVGTLVPYNGAQMLTLYLAPNTGAAFGKAWQVLGDDLPEGRFEMSMMWRVWTRWSDCKSSGDPWAIARVDGGGEVGAVEIATQMVENTDWCDDLVTHPGGRYKNDWQELTIEFDGPVEGPVISFIMGSGTGVDDHHWLVDDVSLRRVQ